MKDLPEATKRYLRRKYSMRSSLGVGNERVEHAVDRSDKAQAKAASVYYKTYRFLHLPLHLDEDLIELDQCRRLRPQKDRHQLK